MSEREMLTQKYSFKEEAANTITHGIGILLSVLGGAYLVISAVKAKNIVAAIAFAIYCCCSAASYVTSTLYHFSKVEKRKRILRVFDHSAIYLSIAGTYTPIALLTLEGWLKYTILIGVWVLAVIGIVIKLSSKMDMNKFKKVSLTLYILMGWMVVIAIKPLLEALSIGFFLWLLFGGISYTVGVVFYTNKKIPFNHAIWHMFVLGGSIFQFVGICKYLT